jgi:hypothetical protein
LPVAPEGDPQEENAAQVDNNNNAASQTAATAHGIEWVRASVNASPLNGNFPRRIWSICNSVGDAVTPGGNCVATHNISPLEFFLLMFPPKQLTDMVRWTNIQLQKS